MRLRLWICAAFSLCTAPAFADVVGAPAVINGNTLRFDKDKVRLFGVDAPDSGQTCQRDGRPWRCDQEAAEQLWNLVAGEYLSCAERERDEQGFITGTCTLADGRDLGALMVASGLARADRKAAGNIYDAAEHAAKQAKLGLWVGDFTPPAP